MPDYEPQRKRVVLNRRCFIVDTNVLVHAFVPTERHHDIAWYVLTETRYQILVSMAVIVETWGILVGKNRDVSAGLEMLQWLRTPGKSVVLDQCSDVDIWHRWIVEYRFDLVDATLCTLGEEITERCSFSPPITVATFDMRDFARVRSRGNFTVLDLHSEYESLVD